MSTSTVPAADPAAPTRLILVRHGQTPSNVRHLLDTAVPGPGLTAVGVGQAAALATALVGVDLGAIYASSHLRAQQTAAPLARERGFPVLVRDGLREVGAGELEMRGDLTSVDRYLTTAFSWPGGDLRVRMPGAETGAEVLERFDRVIAEIAGSGSRSGSRTALVVSHGAVIRVWTAARADNVDAEFAATHSLVNTGMVVLERDPVAGWHVTSWAGAAVVGTSRVVPATDGPGGDALIDPGF